MVKVPKGTLTTQHRFVIDHYGNKVLTGSPVIFCHDNQLYRGIVRELSIFSVTPIDEKFDNISLKIIILENKTKQHYEIRTISSTLLDTEN